MNMLNPKKITGVFFSVFLIFISYCSDVFPGSAVDGVLEKIVENHKKYSGGLSVPYEREILSRSMALLDEDMKSDRASGIFYFRKPDCLRVHQEKPDEEFIIYNSKNMWFYVPAEEVVYQYPGETLGKELNVLCDMFMGFKNPDDDFNVTVTGPAKENAYQVNLTPREEGGEIDHISIAVSADDFKIKKVELYDIAGSIRRFILGDFRIEKDLNDDLFNFTPPEGVEVIIEQ